MADRFPLILNTSANQIQEIASGDQLDLSGNNVANAGIITAGNVTIGAATTDLIVNGDARVTGILTVGTGSLTLNGPSNLVNVGTALTLGHTQGLQFHTQNLHSAGFEVNQINVSGVVTATTFKGNGDFVELDVDGHTNLDNVSIAGVVTATTFVGALTGNPTGTLQTAAQPNITSVGTLSSLNVSGSVSIGGTLTYEDVTNIDSVGIITARSDIKVGTAVTITSAGAGFYAGIVTASSFKLSDGSNVGGTDSDVKFNTVGGTDVATNRTVNSVNNTLFGYQAGKSIFNSDSNVAIGHRALRDIASAGNYNVAVGEGSGIQSLNASYCAFVGNYSGSNCHGEWNVALGYQTLSGGATQVTGDKNVALGGRALYNVSSGANNIGIGYGVGYGNNGDVQLITGSNNILIGFEAAPSSTNVSNEITLGNANISHLRVPGIGVSFSAGGGVVTGIMTASAFKLLDGSNVGGVDSDSMLNTVGGTLSGANFTNSGSSGTSANDNTLFGYSAGRFIALGDGNSCFGVTAGRMISSGMQNTFIGGQAGRNITNSSNNTCVGYQAGYMNNTSGYAVAIGYQAAYNATGSGRLTAMGYQAAKAHTGGNGNTYLGYQAGYLNTGGDMNVVVGDQTVRNSSDFNRATVVGAYAAGGFGSNANNNTVIGYNAGSSTCTGENNTVIGNGAELSGNVSNEVTIGNASVTKFRIPGINVTLKDNGGTPTQGHVLTVDGSGEAGFAAAATVGGSTGVDFNDNVSVRFGTGNDAFIKHTGSDLLIENDTGSLNIKCTSGTGAGEGIVYFASGNGTTRTVLQSDGHFRPYADAAYYLGTSSHRWLNIYTNDLNLSNEGSSNDVDGTWGNFTIQEGESDLFLINKRNGKKYKFNLTEVL